MKTLGQSKLPLLCWRSNSTAWYICHFEIVAEQMKMIPPELSPFLRPSPHFSDEPWLLVSIIFTCRPRLRTWRFWKNRCLPVWWSSIQNKHSWQATLACWFALRTSVYADTNSYETLFSPVLVAVSTKLISIFLNSWGKIFFVFEVFMQGNQSCLLLWP